MKKNAFTLVELLIVMAIVVILASILVGILNPLALVGKANDSERKKDLDRIRKSFEEYFNDKGTYPIDVKNWNIKSNCGKNDINEFIYLKPWPCDPNGEPYKIWVSDDGKSFRILTNLENKNDKIIPDGWYDHESSYLIDGYTINEVNYGVSSLNTTWNVVSLGENCTMDCYQLTITGRCNSAVAGCSGSNCYRDPSCEPSCKVSCCGNNCN